MTHQTAGLLMLLVTVVSGCAASPLRPSPKTTVVHGDGLIQSFGSGPGVEVGEDVELIPGERTLLVGYRGGSVSGSYQPMICGPQGCYGGYSSPGFSWAAETCPITFDLEPAKEYWIWAWSPGFLSGEKTILATDVPENETNRNDVEHIKGWCSLH